jgi:peptidylprolyl isomerase
MEARRPLRQEGGNFPTAGLLEQTRAAMPIPKRCVLLALLGLPLLACESSPAPSPSPSASPSAAATAQPVKAAPSVKAEDSPKIAPSAPEEIPAPPDVAAPPPDAQKTASGLASKVLTPGTGKDHPGPDDRVKVNYTGWTKSGKMFDSSVKHGAPLEFRVTEVIKGWSEGLQLMVNGEKRRFWIPSALAYGDSARMPGAPTGDLVFDVELLSFTAAPKPPKVPEDVREAPKTAKKTASGLAYRVLKPGTGTKQPKPTDTVVVNYTGWTTDGKMFDSTVTRGEPISFKLDQVIKGWTEGLPLMKVGEVTRFWIPANLAYGDKPSGGRPAGMLVFDVELVGIK